MAELSATTVFGPIRVSGKVTAGGGFYGDGSNITSISGSNIISIDAAKITSGTLPAARLAGTYDISLITTSGVVQAATHKSVSTTAPGFQGLLGDSASIPSYSWDGDFDTGMYRMGADAIGFTIGGTHRMKIYSTGVEVTGTIVSTGNVSAYSDRRLKEHILPIGDAIHKFTQLNGVTYNRIGHSERETGLIAQDVHAVLPEAVSFDEHGKMLLAYGNIMGLAVEAFKELHDDVKQLRAELSSLKTKDN